MPKSFLQFEEQQNPLSFAYLPQTMRPKPHYPLNVKVLLSGLALVFILLFLLRSYCSPSNENLSSNSLPPTKKTRSKGTQNCSLPCTKLPVSLVHALIHYSTSSITPQQTLKEISVTAKILQKKSPCNFPVFGLGHDSLIKVNQAGNLIEVGKRPVCTSVGDIRDSFCPLALKGLPKEVYETKWDLIMVDAPTGYFDEAPGRMTAIYTAGMMARNREDGETDVFVHDVNREVEDKFSKEFLCEGYMKKQEGRLRHFTIHSHGSDRPFCP
ncbi:hypothetical protein Cgig2_021967 [Carnegiea gigantea]|uniref:Polysaccharide biosynthesis domain-containing protein n=1 Tax=Carnegiea gigantea TaxID=171969 RepID=A0A9Q1KRG6_9CARY|nr:hypothetical protein Cgig2_021967 [Carnegiea gigantea]